MERLPQDTLQETPGETLHTPRNPQGDPPGDALNLILFSIIDSSLRLGFNYLSLKPVRNLYLCWRVIFNTRLPTARKLSHVWVSQQAEERVLICDVVVLLPLRSLENLRILHHHYGTALKALSWHGAQDSGALR